MPGEHGALCVRVEGGGDIAAHERALARGVGGAGAGAAGGPGEDGARGLAVWAVQGPALPRWAGVAHQERFCKRRA